MIKDHIVNPVVLLDINLKKQLLCQMSLFQHVRVGMGYDYVPEDMKNLCNWVQSQWNPKQPRRRNALVQVMRDSFKSTTITQSYPSWVLSQNPNLSILIVSKIHNNAQNFTDAQRKRWESEDFENIFGKWKHFNNKWDAGRINIHTRTKHRKEPSLMCAGIGTTLTSLHFDIIIADDITGMEDMYSNADREASWRFYKSLFDLLDKKHGLLIVVGTCWHENDVLMRIRKQNRNKVKDGVDPFHIYYRPAYREQTPDKYEFSWIDEKFVKQLRADKADIRDFSANYLLKPLPDAYKIYNLEKMYYYDYGKLGMPEFIVMFIDPSLNDTKKSDYSAIVWIGAIQGKLYVLGADLDQRKPSVTIQAIGEDYQKLQGEFKGVEIFVYMETVAFQQFMKDEAVNQLCNEGKYVPIQNYGQNKNKIARITAMEKYCSSGIVQFRKDWNDYESYRLLMEHLSVFPLGEHDDGADALEGGINICMQMV